MKQPEKFRSIKDVYLSNKPVGHVVSISNVYKSVLQEAVLKKGDFDATNSPYKQERIDKLIQKLETKEKFVPAGGTVASIEIDVDDKWLNDL